MPISSQTPIIGYVANGVTKSFAFPFVILSADDLKVKVGADVVTAGFSITGVGDRDGGSVTFADAPASLTPIILYREVTLDRTTDYQENGDLLAIVLDDDLDRIWMALQDQLLLADRAVRAPIGETLQQLPPASERALMALAFDAAGNPIVVRGTNDGGAALALDLMDTAPGKGAALVGYNANQTAKSKLDEQALTPLDFAHLATNVSAKYLAVPSSFLVSPFKNWLPAIQAAIDAASAAGGGTVLIPKHTEPFYVNDFVELKSNVTLEFEDWVILADTSTNGAGIVALDAENVTINNILLDCSNLNAGGTGENGLGVVKGKNIRVTGGLIKNCRAGTTIPMLGGKAIQVEASGTTGFVADGVHIQDSDVAMSSMRDGSASSPQMSGVEFTNIKAYDCGILLWVKQDNIGANRGTGLEHTVQLSNFYARNCGTNEGVFQFGGSGNVQVSDGVVIMDDAAGPTSLIRGSHNNCTFSNIDFYANTNSVINLDVSANGFGTYPNENNRYDIRVLGTVNYLVDAGAATTNRILLGCDGRFILKNDVASAFFGAELRNGTSTFDITHNERTVRISTVYGNSSVGVVKKFSDLPNEGPNIPQLFTQALTFPTTQNQSSDPNTLDDYKENGTTAITLTDTSGGTLLATGTADYTKIGRMVFVSLSVTWPTTSETFTAKIGGLPYATANNGGRTTVGFGLRITDVGSPVSVSVNANSTEMLFISSAGAVMTNANLSGKTVSGLLTYMSAT